MPDLDNSLALQSRVQQAIARDQTLYIHAGNTKQFLGNASLGLPLDVSTHRGILHYAPSELVITARAGTPLVEIEAALAEQQQMLAFEPPHYAQGATLGGTIACNLSGPRRAYTGAVRDYVLGTRIINGKGEILHFGGEVMKNVAGYDVSRLMAGAMGTLGVLLDASLKTVPRPQAECTIKLDCSHTEAVQKMHQWATLPLPVSATCYDMENLYVRLSGAAAAVEQASRRLGGERLEDNDVWQRIREHRYGFFSTQRPLWRISLASDTPLPDLEGKWLYEWGGALRWLISNEPAGRVHAFARAAGGYAMAFRHHAENSDYLEMPAPALLALHQRIKQAMDPAGIFNPGRMFAQI